MKRFALIGAAGYVAPRHMRAIRDTGNLLVAVLDPYDGIGVMDEFFPEADFFTEPERFDRHLDKLRRIPGQRIDYVSICSPNYLHDAHIRMALRNEADAICEKPLVLNPWNVDALEHLETETGRKINVILQLRLHPSVRSLKEKVEAEGPERWHEVELTYVTARGKWYQRSWKGDEEKSGGIATNIGIHFFDMLTWIFGPHQSTELHHRDAFTMSGVSILKNARVSWLLSVDARFLPADVQSEGKRSFRELKLDGETFTFSDGFYNLHTDSYQHILHGEGFGPADARESIRMVHAMRSLSISKPGEHTHPGYIKI